MTEDDIISLAHKANLPFWTNTGIPIHLNELRRFADLVLEHNKQKKINFKSKDICDND